VIGYQLPEAGRVTLTVYNVLGQEVAVLVDGMQEAGYRSVEFDASRYAGMSGVYYYRLRAGEYTLTRKLMVIR